MREMFLLITESYVSFIICYFPMIVRDDLQGKRAIIVFLDVIRHPLFYLKERFREWIMSLSSGKNLLSWA